jgi:soluble lytic murein transglycosylase-like protein
VAAKRPQTAAGRLVRACGPSPLSAEQTETLVERVATMHGVDPQLAKAVAWAESRYDRVRNSPKGARGPMQLMPATALELGVTDICDPRANIDAGVRHLKQLLTRFGNPLLAVAAYNAGSRAVTDHNGIPPFAETLGYVARVINRQLDLPAGQGAADMALATAAALPQPEAQSHVLGAVAHQFIDGVMHLPSQGGLP